MKSLVTCLAVLFFFAVGELRAAAYVPTPERMAVALRAAELVATEDYETALQLADSLITVTPQIPDGYLLRATVLNSRSIDFEDRIDQDELNANCDTVIAQCTRMIAQDGESAAVQFYLGTALSFKAIIEGRTGKWINVISGLMRAAALFEEAVKLDSTFSDAYYCVGMMYYFQSSKAGVLRMVGVVSDRRELGKQYIRIGQARGNLTRVVSESSLAWIAIEEKDYDQAISIARSLLVRFPNKRSFLWCLGSAQIKGERWREAIETFNTLLLASRKQTRNNHHNEVGCLHSLAKAHSALGEWDDVVKLADEALAIPLSKEIAGRKKDDLSRLKKMRVEALEQLNRQ